MLNAAEATYWLDYPFTEEPRKEPEMPENNAPRFVPAVASYTEDNGRSYGPLWGVHDTELQRFAPFGGPESLAIKAAEAMEADPVGWAFATNFTLYNS